MKISVVFRSKEQKRLIEVTDSVKEAVNAIGPYLSGFIIGSYGMYDIRITISPVKRKEK